MIWWLKSLNAYKLHMNSANLFALWFRCLPILTYSLRITFAKMCRRSSQAICGSIHMLKISFRRKCNAIQYNACTSLDIFIRRKHTHPACRRWQVRETDTFCAISRQIRYKFELCGISGASASVFTWTSRCVARILLLSTACGLCLCVTQMLFTSVFYGNE